jgi:hypothetical protein
VNLNKDIKPNRPKPIIGKVDVMPFRKKMDHKLAIDALLAGNFVIISDAYSTGLIVLRALKNYLENKLNDKTFKDQREFRSTYRELSNKVVLHVFNHKLKAKKSPEIGWLKKLYPELDDFLLPFPQVQGLNSAWQWYQKGILIPVLKRKIHPFFGTYFPTRFEHIDLFDDWLKNFKGSKGLAYDVGVGSGVLSYQMLNHGFQKVKGTDTNPNAIVGLEEQKVKGLELLYGNLFVDSIEKSDLIVFNPPWLPATHNIDGIDKAIYYAEELFEDFFEQTKQRLNPNGKVILLFSNLAEVSNAVKKNPIAEEIKNNKRFQLDELIEGKVGKASSKTKRDQKWRSKEKVQLWILKHI